MTGWPIKSQRRRGLDKAGEVIRKRPGQRSTCRVRGHIVAASRTACLLYKSVFSGNNGSRILQEAQLMLTTGSTRLAVSRGQQTWYHFGSIATFR